jgi:tetratricopeptide (TPR) repeat protein
MAAYSESPDDWWPAYRAAWILNRLDMPDSAAVLASRALQLRPGSAPVLGELLRALSQEPDSVLKYSRLVSGGGVCRFRLAQAERKAGVAAGHTSYLLETLGSGTDSARADAACWLSMLMPDSSLRLMELAVALSPDDPFYRTVLGGELASAGYPDRGLAVLEPLEPQGYYYWQAMARCLEAADSLEAAAGAFRMAYSARRCPSAAADLGWFLYRAGRDLARQDRCAEALPLLREAAGLWHGDSAWACAAGSLAVLAEEFLEAGTGWERVP